MYSGIRRQMVIHYEFIFLYHTSRKCPNLLSSIKQWIPRLSRVLRLITAEPAVLYSRLMPSKIAVRNLGANVNTCRAESTGKCYYIAISVSCTIPQENVQIFLSSIKQWIPRLSRVLRLITAEPAVLYSRLMPSKIAVRKLGANVNTCTAESTGKC